MEEYTYTPKPRTLRKLRRFEPADIEAEEQYLAEMHRQGWKFTGFVDGLTIFSFEECPPEETVYRIDVHPRAKKERDSYLQMYKDYGWDCALASHPYYYFRKPVADTTPADREVFSDDSSRLDMMRNVFRNDFWFTVFCAVMFTGTAVLAYAETGRGPLFLCLLIASLIANLLLLRQGIGYLKFLKKYSHK